METKARLERRVQRIQNKINTYFAHTQSIFDKIKVLEEDSSQQAIVDFMASASTVDSIRDSFISSLEERNNLLELNDDVGEPSYESLLAYEQLFSQIKYKQQLLLPSTSNNDSNTTSGVPNKQSHKLPRLELCSFNGDVESWPTFYENFRTVIHENSELSDREKVQYLVGRLTGAARSIVQGIVPSEQNYSIIWKALLDKYNDKSMLGYTYLDRLFELPAVSNTSALQLEQFIDSYSATISSLKQVGLSNLEEFILIYIGSKKISVEVIKEFEMSLKGQCDPPTSAQFIEFVRKQAQLLQRANTVGISLSNNNNNLVKSNTVQVRKSNSPSALAKTRNNNNNNNNNFKTFVNVQENCVSCGKLNHTIITCPKFLELSPQSRFDFIKSNNACINCLSAKHKIRNCKSMSKCRTCARNHNTLLHFPMNSNNESPCSPTAVLTPERTPARAPVPANRAQGLSSGGNESVQSTTAAVSLCAFSDCKAKVPTSASRTVLLGTAQCNVIDSEGNIQVVRVLVDSASQQNLITSECCNRLSLQLFEPHIKSVSGVGDIQNPIMGTTCLTIRSRYDDAIRFTLQPFVVNSITSELPNARIDTSCLEYLNEIPLADNSYFNPSGVDLIVNCDIFARILRPNTIARDLGEPVAIDTSFGYIIVGHAPIKSAPYRADNYCAFVKGVEGSLHKFFELEEVPIIPSPENKECEKLYCSSITRDTRGRYVVSLPFEDSPAKLGDSKEAALKRFYSLERKLNNNPQIKLEYDKVFYEYLDKGYLNQVGDLSSLTSEEPYYVIPHHAVIRTDKSTTKLRIVNDASMKTTTNVSLNDILHTGQNLQNDLFQIILNLRLFSFAISADIRQMYLRILVDDKDHKFQRVLYRFDDKNPVQVFEITRVVFGLCCSPYLAIRTVRQLANDEGHKYPIAASVAKRDFYTDDVASSCNSAEEAIELSKQLIQLFSSCDMELVKFSSNSPEVMETIPLSHRVSDTVEFSSGDQLKILGLHWMPAEDMFTFLVEPEYRKCTKRNILSTIARLWDLMGYVAPVTLYAKLIVKYLWTSNVDWDEVPPQNIISLWHQFISELHCLQNVKLPRHLGVTSECVITLLGFADASEQAYGGVVYLHVYFPNENKYVLNLVSAKSRVAPLRNVTLARLELCGCLILAKLLRTVIDTYVQRCSIHNIYAFTDSTVALAWIHSSPARWQTFVANRVSQIQENIDPAHFYHIAGKQNPADCLSRGLTPAQLVEHPSWFDGPQFAHSPLSEWPVKDFDKLNVPEALPEMKTTVLTSVVPAQSDTSLIYNLSKRFSSWPKYVRCVMYILRFIKKLPHQFEIAHYETAELFIIKQLQLEHFAKERKCIEHGKLGSPAFLKLNAYLHEGVLRVGGRLSNAELSYDSCHPILLPSRDHIIDLLIDYYHRKHLHTGPQLLMSLMRQKYWILSARNIVRKRVQLCNTCFRLNPKNTFPMMADLPACRVQQAKAFCHTGVDFAGPLSIIPYRRRGVRSQKAYLCLFVCLVTKAVHLELASDLSTGVFLNAFKRFLARRGPVSTMYSDCGTNFIGANNHLKETYKLINSQEYRDKFANELRENAIEWKTNPARSPHFGGIWEINVRSVKGLLVKTVGSQLLTFEEMLTVISQIEAILNSRPLSVLSSDPSEPLALTPAHFLTLTPLKSLPVEELPQDKINLLNRKRMVDQIVQSFWKRWKIEYLNTLQPRQKWTNLTEPITVGTVVLLKSDNSAPLDWPLGIVERCFPGSDGVIRVVNVRTKTGTYRRPVVKIFPLPTQ